MKIKSVLRIVAIIILVLIAFLILKDPKETSRGFRDGIEAARK